MKHTSFTRDPDGDTILITTRTIKGKRLQMVLDTGASHTVVDKNVLLMEGFNLDNPVGSVLVETANGVVEAELFELEFLSALGLTRRSVEVQVYDFIEHRILSSYQGVLGLDFFEGTEFTVNMVKNTIKVEILTNT
jgi:predicted aspartyl protease